MVRVYVCNFILGKDLYVLKVIWLGLQENTNQGVMEDALPATQPETTRRRYYEGSRNYVD
jgi:hypothetical protein